MEMSAGDGGFYRDSCSETHGFYGKILANPGVQKRKPPS